MAWNDTTSCHVEITGMEGGQALRVNDLTKDFVDSSNWVSASRYVPVMDIPRQFYTRNGTAFLANIGSGAIVRNYSAAGWHIDVAEPDSGILHAAIAGFRTVIPESSLIRGRGRAYLSSHTNTYDVILVDGIAPASLPTPMMTEEFFELVHSRLQNDGIFAIAIQSVGWHDALVVSLGRTLKEIFKKVLVLPIAEPPNTFGSIVLLATDAPRDLAQEPERNTEFDPEWRYGAGYQRTHAWDNSFVPEVENGKLLTDGTSRLDTLFTKIADSARVQNPHYLP